MQAIDIDPEPITNWLLLVIAIGGVVSLISAVVVFVNRRFEKRVTNLIKETTKPIQPDSNGGLSMTDLHQKVDRIEQRYDTALENLERTRTEWHERYVEDQSRIRREWTAVFIAIRKMIHLPADEQAAMWDEITDSYIDGTIGAKFPDERQGNV